jgi:hypothetical protein
LTRRVERPAAGKRTSITFTGRRPDDERNGTVKRRSLVHEHVLEWLQEQAEDDADSRDGQNRSAGTDARKAVSARS